MNDLFAGIDPQLSILLNVLIAIILGGILGYEREYKGKPAGFRTNMLIAGIAALLILLGGHVVDMIQGYIHDEGLGADPIRLIQAIVVGVSFIGAGTILKSKSEETVHYLTTAATILFSAGIGMCVGLHLYIVAIGITVFGLLINNVVKKVERNFFHYKNNKSV